MFSVYTLTVYGSNLTKACFVMYHLVTHPVESPLNFLTHMYWLVISIAYMYLITIPGAMLNSTVSLKRTLSCKILSVAGDEP